MKDSLTEYKDYRAKIEFDQEDKIFVGQVLDVNDDLFFHGTTESELVETFHNCIDNYLDYCDEAGKYC